MFLMLKKFDYLLWDNNNFLNQIYLKYKNHLRFFILFGIGWKWFLLYTCMYVPQIIIKSNIQYSYTLKFHLKVFTLIFDHNLIRFQNQYF